VDKIHRERRNQLVRQIWADETGEDHGPICWRTAEKISISCNKSAPHRLKNREWYKVLRQMIALYLEECRQFGWEPSFFFFRKNMYVYGLLWRHLAYEDNPVVIQVYSELESLSVDDVSGFGRSLLE